MLPASPLHSSGPGRPTSDAADVRRALLDLRVQLEATRGSLDLLEGELRAATSGTATAERPGPDDRHPA